MKCFPLVAGEGLEPTTSGLSLCATRVTEKILGCFALFLDFFEHFANPCSLHLPLAAFAGVAQRATLVDLITRKASVQHFLIVKKTIPKPKGLRIIFWLRGKDLNQRPPGYEPDELPTALPRDMFGTRVPYYNIISVCVCQALF